MARGAPSNWRRPGAGSWLANWLEKRQLHPQAFTAGLYDNGRWRFKPSAVDPYRPTDVVTMQHGDRTLRLRPEGVTGAGPREGHVVVAARDVDAEQHVQLSVPLGEVGNFGLDV
ncbi:hypothetical protein [uncultured Jatrophihabitans sp.]|uniref:hypothetical protein n=1 Tax=uncultured Jatrophihabitans sp. TaxID=1610747 RepID=UPI0035C983AE